MLGVRVHRLYQLAQLDGLVLQVSHWRRHFGPARAQQRAIRTRDEEAQLLALLVVQRQTIPVALGQRRLVADMAGRSL